MPVTPTPTPINTTYTPNLFLANKKLQDGTIDVSLMEIAFGVPGSISGMDPENTVELRYGPYGVYDPLTWTVVSLNSNDFCLRQDLGTVEGIPGYSNSPPYGNGPIFSSVLAQFTVSIMGNTYQEINVQARNIGSNPSDWRSDVIGFGINGSGPHVGNGFFLESCPPAIVPTLTPTRWLTKTPTPTPTLTSTPTLTKTQTPTLTGSSVLVSTPTLTATYGLTPTPTILPCSCNMEEYTLELVFKPEPDNTTFGKLIDFNNKTLDNGIYAYDNGTSLYILYIPGGYVGQTQIDTASYNQLVISRNKDTKNVCVFLNKIKQFEFVDSLDDLVLNDSVWFFVDDNTTDNENIGNRVSKIKLFSYCYSQQEIIDLPIFHGKTSICTTIGPWNRPGTTTPAPQSFCAINSIEDIPSSLFLSIDCEYEATTTSAPTTTTTTTTTSSPYFTTTTAPVTTTTTTTTTTLSYCLPEFAKNISILCSNPGDTSSIVSAIISWDYPTYLCNSMIGWSTTYILEAMYNSELPGSSWSQIDSIPAILYNGPNTGITPRATAQVDINRNLGNHLFRVTAKYWNGIVGGYSSISVVTPQINWSDCSLITTTTTTTTSGPTTTTTSGPTTTTTSGPTTTTTSGPTTTTTTTTTTIDPNLKVLWVSWV